MTQDDIIRIAEDNGWSVYVDGTDGYELSQFSPAGEDFNFYIHADTESNDDFISELRDYWEGYDPDYEATFWIGEDGHGHRGAPYHIKDIVTDKEAIKDMVFELYTAFRKEAA